VISYDNAASKNGGVQSGLQIAGVIAYIRRKMVSYATRKKSRCTTLWISGLYALP